MRNCCLILFSFFLFSVSAQSPSAVVERYLEAVGGRSALENVKTIKARISVEANGFEMDGNVALSLPDKQYTEMIFRDDKIVEVINGGEGWMRNPMTGSSALIPMTKNQIHTKRIHLMAGRFLNASLYNLEDLGEKKIKGQNYRVLKVTFKDGLAAQHYYFSTATGLIDYMEADASVGGGMFTAFEKYTNIGGVKFPQAILRYTGSNLNAPSMTMVIKNMEVNTTLDQKLFNTPE